MDWIPAFMSYTWWSAHAVFRASETVVRSMVFNNGLYDVDFKPPRAKKKHPATAGKRRIQYRIQLNMSKGLPIFTWRPVSGWPSVVTNEHGLIVSGM